MAFADMAGSFGPIPQPHPIVPGPVFSGRDPGPVVQSIISFKSSLMTNSLTVIAIFCLFLFLFFFSPAKHINEFAIFQGGHSKIMLANNFVKFLTTGP